MTYIEGSLAKGENVYKIFPHHWMVKFSILFHMLVMLSSCDVDFKSVLIELERREGKSGLIEKAERKNN